MRLAPWPRPPARPRRNAARRAGWRPSPAAIERIVVALLGHRRDHPGRAGVHHRIHPRAGCRVTWAPTESPRRMGRSGVTPMIVGTVLVTGMAVLIAAPSAWPRRSFSPVHHGRTPHRRDRFGADCGRHSVDRLRALRLRFLRHHAGAGPVHPLRHFDPDPDSAAHHHPHQREAIRAVPYAYREASYGLGGTNWQTIVYVVLSRRCPAQHRRHPRWAGAADGRGHADRRVALGLPHSMFDSSRTLALHFYYLAQENISEANAYATAAVLVIAILTINLFAYWLMKRFIARGGRHA